MEHMKTTTNQIAKFTAYTNARAARATIKRIGEFGAKMKRLFRKEDAVPMTKEDAQKLALTFPAQSVVEAVEGQFGGWFLYGA